MVGLKLFMKRCCMFCFTGPNKSVKWREGEGEGEGDTQKYTKTYCKFTCTAIKIGGGHTWTHPGSATDHMDRPPGQKVCVGGGGEGSRVDKPHPLGIYALIYLYHRERTHWWLDWLPFKATDGMLVLTQTTLHNVYSFAHAFLRKCISFCVPRGPTWPCSGYLLTQR